MQPNFRIIANKSDITKTVNGRLLSLEITDEIGIVSDSLTMQLDDRDGAIAVPPRGQNWWFIWDMTTYPRWADL